jgi:hypothetical protein
VAEAVCELGLATLVGELPALDAFCVAEPALVAGLPLGPLAGLFVPAPAAELPVRPEAEPAL